MEVKDILEPLSLLMVACGSVVAIFGFLIKWLVKSMTNGIDRMVRHVDHLEETFRREIDRLARELKELVGTLSATQANQDSIVRRLDSMEVKMHDIREKLSKELLT